MRIFSRLRSKRTVAQPAFSPDAREPSPPDTALRDAMLRGWFNNETGELYTGFMIGPDDVVADIGCGVGHNARFCANRGARLILADINPDSIAQAAQRVAAEPNNNGFEIHVTDGDPLPIADETATRVICTEVIEHVDSAERLMAELARIGRPGALYLLSCPDAKSEALQQRIAPDFHFQKPNHIRVVQPDDFTRYVEDAGLVVERRSSHGFFHMIWMSFFWTTKASLEQPADPLLDSWARTWQMLLDQPRGNIVKQAFDDLLPCSQMIIARKVPAG